MDKSYWVVTWSPCSHSYAGQTLVTEDLLEVAGVFEARIGRDPHHHITVGGLEFLDGMNHGAGRGPNREPLLAPQPLGGVIGGPVVDPDHVVDDAPVEDLGLLRLLEALEAGEAMTRLRFDCDYLYRRVAFL